MKFPSYLPLARYLALATVAVPTLVGCANCDSSGLLGRRHKGPTTIEAACFGYHSTCWQRWPEDCINCPSPYDKAMGGNPSAMDPGIAPPSTAVAPALTKPTAQRPTPESVHRAPAIPAPTRPAQATPEIARPAVPPQVRSAPTAPAAPIAEPPAVDRTPEAPAVPEAPVPNPPSDEQPPQGVTLSRSVSQGIRNRMLQKNETDTSSFETPKRVLLSSEPTAKFQISKEVIAPVVSRDPNSPYTKQEPNPPIQLGGQATPAVDDAGSTTDPGFSSEEPFSQEEPRSGLSVREVAPEAAPMPAPVPTLVPGSNLETAPALPEAPLPAELPNFRPSTGEKVSKLFLPFSLRNRF